MKYSKARNVIGQYDSYGNGFFRKILERNETKKVITGDVIRAYLNLKGFIDVEEDRPVLEQFAEYVDRAIALSTIRDDDTGYWMYKVDTEKYISELHGIVRDAQEKLRESQILAIKYGNELIDLRHKYEIQGN